jgi:hypothetical protein
MTELDRLRGSHKVTAFWEEWAATLLVTARYATGLCVRPRGPGSRIQVVGCDTTPTPVQVINNSPNEEDNERDQDIQQDGHWSPPPLGSPSVHPRRGIVTVVPGWFAYHQDNYIRLAAAVEEPSSAAP